MANQPLKWGLLSTANINRALIPPLRVSERNRVAAVGSRTQAAADAYAAQWNIPKAYGTYDALLADPEIDVIYNPLPNHMHAEWTIKALEAGKHVLCEKPFAMTLAEVDAMVAAQAKSGKVLAEAFMYRHHPQTLKVKALVEGGAIGKLQLIRGVFTFNIDHEVDIRLDPTKGGGAIWDVGCYPISYARLIAGVEPVTVYGRQAIGAKSGVDESFYGLLTFPGDIYAEFDCGFRSPLRQHMEVVGTDGTITVPMCYQPSEDETITVRSGKKTEAIKIEPRELYIGELEDMADCILSGKSQRMSLADSKGNIATILALIESAKSGRPVAL